MTECRVTLIITTYNWVEALEMVLLSVLRQTKMPDEIIIADDGSSEDTRVFIESMAPRFSVPLHHVWHEDDGFRRSHILNKALCQVQGDYIIQVDGDVILHRHFVRDHGYFSRKGCFIRGYRHMLSSEKTQKTFSTKRLDFYPTLNIRHLFRLSFHSLFLTRISLYDQKNRKQLSGLLGCNMSYWKDDALAINGYDEDIEGWGGEDTDFGVRLENHGVEKLRLKFAGIQHHLYHPEASRSSYTENRAVYHESHATGRVVCTNGISKMGAE